MDMLGVTNGTELIEQARDREAFEALEALEGDPHVVVGARYANWTNAETEIEAKRSNPIDDIQNLIKQSAARMFGNGPHTVSTEEGIDVIRDKDGKPVAFMPCGTFAAIEERAHPARILDPETGEIRELAPDEHLVHDAHGRVCGFRRVPFTMRDEGPKRARIELPPKIEHDVPPAPDGDQTVSVTVDAEKIRDVIGGAIDVPSGVRCEATDPMTGAPVKPFVRHPNAREGEKPIPVDLSTLSTRELELTREHLIATFPAHPPEPAGRFDLVVSESECADCNRPIARGEVFYLDPIAPRSAVSLPKCVACVRGPLLARWEEYERISSAHFDRLKAIELEIHRREDRT